MHKKRKYDVMRLLPCTWNRPEKERESLAFNVEVCQLKVLLSQAGYWSRLVMATKHECQESPEYSTFREHYDRLYRAIQDPLSLSVQLFSKGIISSAVQQRMAILGLSILEKNNELLSAVGMQIRTNSQTFHEFVSALNEDPSMQSLVQSKYSTVCD